MLKLAAVRGISMLDTAADYGNSQKRLGELSHPVALTQYVTKFSLPPENCEPTPENIFLESMRQLKVERLHGLLFHKMSDLDDQRCGRTLEILRSARESGLIDRIGVSVYNQADLNNALSIFPDMDILQLPANLLDKRLLSSPEVQQLHRAGAEIHVRSVFLQGLLLSDPAQLDDYFSDLTPVLMTLSEVSRASGFSVLELILGTMRKQTEIDVVLVGATSASELDEISTAWNASRDVPDFDIPEIPSHLLDPRNWPQIRIKP